MTMIINKIKLLSAFMAFAFVVFTSCSTNERKGSTNFNKETAIQVTVATPAIHEGNAISMSGQVEASQTANISTRLMGYITKLTVNVGDHVQAGQLIASISNTDIIAKRSQADAMIAEAAAAMKSAQKDFDRFTILYKQQSASAKELDNVTLQYNAMKAKTEAAKQMRNEINAMLAYTKLTAPFAGIVTQKLADAGNMASPGMPIVTIEKSGTYQIAAAVAESAIKQIKMGEAVKVTIKSINKSFQGKIVQINESSQFTGGQYLIKISIPDKEKKGLYAGMYANISILSQQTASSTQVSDAVLVPLSVIINKDQLTGLYTISSTNTALLRWVRLGKSYGDKVEVISGLGKEEPYIMLAEGNLYNGVPVKIKK